MAHFERLNVDLSIVGDRVRPQSTSDNRTQQNNNNFCEDPTSCLIYAMIFLNNHCKVKYYEFLNFNAPNSFTEEQFKFFSLETIMKQTKHFMDYPD